ncbi:MAG: hypothetical protein ABIM30_01075 [candidate division WOR-3 bacterium]
MPKKKRDMVKNVGLKKEFFAKHKRELLDVDYLNKLTNKELAWLSVFFEEYAGARFNHPKKKLHKPHHRKEIYNNNNSRARDIYNKFKKLRLD